MISINFFTVFSQVLILFFILFLGFFMRKYNIVDENLNENLANIVLSISFPALILISMDYEFSLERLITIRDMFLITLVIFLIMIAIAYVVVNYVMSSTPDKNSIYQFMIVFGNTVFIGFPIIDVIFGREGIFLAAIYNLVVNIFLWTFGVIIMTKDEQGGGFSYKKLLNPGIVAVILGFVIFLFSIEIPGLINDLLEMLGGTTTPLALLVVGSTLAKVEVSNVFSNFKLWTIALFRQLVFPLLVFIILNLLNFDFLIVSISVILTGMPIASLTAIFAERYKKHPPVVASEGVFFGTLLALVTIPLVVSIIT
ncbi:AEC family transporter [Natroniella sulfidigena]|uniref:AEC family transporter n=1 Tax=Natroniella sulfidigena TaxID=723921 RepID=UPI0024A7708D|nr:AEC family transporter [Natroniella sulfidigena]